MQRERERKRADDTILNLLEILLLLISLHLLGKVNFVARNQPNDHRELELGVFIPVLLNLFLARASLSLLALALLSRAELRLTPLV